MKRVDLKVRDSENPKIFCQQCGAVLTRKRFSNGAPPESEDQFYKRKFCGEKCFAAWETGRPEKQTLMNLENDRKGRKIRCKRCNKLKKKDEFVKDKTRPRGIFPWCKQCHVESQRTYKSVVNETKFDGELCPVCLQHIGTDAHFNKIFCSSKCKGRSSRLRQFGLTPDEFRTLTKSGKCPICLHNVTRWVLDHNHDTGETTGPVCQRCNITLLAGSAHDAERAQRLTDYLRHSPVASVLGEKRFVGPPTASNLHRMWLWTGRDS